MNRTDCFKILIRKAINDGHILNQADLASKMGYNPVVFSQIINGSKTEPKQFLAKMVNYIPNADLSNFDAIETQTAPGVVNTDTEIHVNGNQGNIGSVGGDGSVQVSSNPTIEKLFAIIEKQQQTIERQQTIIEKLTEK